MFFHLFICLFVFNLFFIYYLFFLLFYSSILFNHLFMYLLIVSENTANIDV